MAHTPLPWEFSERTNSLGSLSYMITGGHDSHGGWDEFENIAQIHGKRGGVNEANAEMIVRAVNSYENLVETHKKIAFGDLPLNGATEEDLWAYIRDVARISRAALEHTHTK